MNTIEQNIIDAICEALSGIDLSSASVSLEYPADVSNGDYASNVAMVLAKQAGKNPRELAERVVQHLPSIEGVVRVDVAGPGFINFTLSPDFFVQKIKEIIVQGDTWGEGSTLKGQTWVIEHASPNPNKAMHIGHLRNCVIGMALIRITRAAGARVIADAVDNNRGIAIAKLMWGYVRFAKKDGDSSKTLSYWFTHQDEWHTPESKGMLPDRFIDELYVLGNEDFEKFLESEQAVRDLVVAWEAGDEATWALWERVLEYSHRGQARTLARLGSVFDHWWHEHEHYQKGKELVSEGLKKGIFRKLTEGGVLTNLEAYNIPDTIVEKKDGTSLYITQDIALTKLKKEKWKPDKMVWVVGPEQSLAMQQVFAVCEQLGIGTRDEFLHLPYGYMSIKGVGKMSSRKGTVVYVDEVIDATREKTLELLKGRDVTDREVLAEMLALGAIKYAILRSGRMRDIAFDRENATRIEGDSGPYLQYAHTRAVSILRKAEAEGVANIWISDTRVLGEHPLGERVLLERLLVRFPDVVARAQKEYEPHYITTYLTELAGAFNSWYAKEKIVDQSDSTSPYKVALTDAFRITMKNGLYLLGIEAPEKM